ncbi:class I SAM-dependent methyltransferase [Magnetospirillum molischianum]|uniref:Predicted methyltransferase n=1 Tax=Magnetospirillum molischianum DSM 120 TaxID=1150626 RepID=H8FX37_MAGML|nr:50S ribosomal protein L11 methyltransferase [Magnetospirillum molischianum]CCG42925.1 Predicted methyltransferase [Magnetospirillum molischianum DSM 120]
MTVAPPADPAAFIRAHTLPASPPACPEIRLWSATEITPIWEATEAWLEANGVPPPYWAFCWAGGQALTRWVLDNPAEVAGLRVLDFAAGSGATAIAAAMSGAARVEAAEIDPIACAAIALNAELNGVQVELVEGDLVGAACRWDLVVAGDVCYEAPMTAHILPWLKNLAASGAKVILADPGRAYLPRIGLRRLADYSVVTSLELEDRNLREVSIYTLAG